MSDAAASPIRSPSYPSMALRDAIDAVGKIESKYRSSSVDREVAARLIGYSSLSGPANKALAALVSFGLLERAGKGEARVTQRARAILHAIDEQERKENLLAAAYEPDLFRELRERFSEIPVPPEDGVISYLNRQGFNPSAVRPAAKAFRQTMEYVAELVANDALKPVDGRPDPLPASGMPAAKYVSAKVGDLVQWESQGALQLKAPLRVRSVSPDNEWIAVEGSETGIPMSQVIIVESAASDAATMPRFPLAPNAGAPTLAPVGETEWMRNKVGRDTYVRICVSGDMGPKEIQRLIKLLEAQRAVLIEDEEEDDPLA